MSGHDIMAVVSLVVLIGAIVFGFIKKVNVGLLSVGLALIVGKAAGMSDSDIVGGWGTNLFMILLGTTFLFGILQANGTLDLLARKIVAAAGRQARMIPWALFVMGAERAAAFWREHGGGEDGFTFVLVTDAGEVLYSENAPFTPNGERAQRIVAQPD